MIAFGDVVFLCRALLDTLLDSMDASMLGITDTGQSVRICDEVPGSSQTARILNLFAFLLNQAQAAVKAAVLYLPQSGYVRLRYIDKGCYKVHNT